MKKSNKLKIIIFVLLLLEIVCGNKNKNQYANIVEPNLKQYLLPTNDLWISTDETPQILKILEGNNFKETNYTLSKNQLFEIVGAYPSIENPEYYLVYRPYEFHWISSKIKKRKPIENKEIKSFYLQKSDLYDAEKLVIQADFRLNEIEIYEEADFKSKILANVKEDDVLSMGKYVPKIIDKNPLKILLVTDKKDRYFNKLGNWINVSHKNINGYVFSSEVVPLVENCSKFPNLKEANLTSEKNDIINMNGENIEETFWYRTNLWGLVIKSESEYSFALAKLVSFCREDTKYQLAKILDIKHFPSPDSRSSYESHNTQMNCKNKEYSGDNLFVIFEGHYTSNIVRNTFYIDTRNENIIELNSTQTTCKDVCDDQSGCD